jgi:hypothetical protein
MGWKGMYPVWKQDDVADDCGVAALILRTVSTINP